MLLCSARVPGIALSPPPFFFRMAASSNETPDVLYDTENDMLSVVLKTNNEEMLRQYGFASLKEHMSSNLPQYHARDVYFRAYRDERHGIVSITMVLYNVADMKSVSRAEYFLQYMVDTYDCRSSASAVCNATRAATMDPNLAISSVEGESAVRPRRALGVANDCRTSRPIVRAYSSALAV